MKKTILLSCHEAPCDGGAATFMYLLFEYLQKLDYDVYYLTLSSKTKVNMYERNLGRSWWNPAHLNNVHLYISENFNRREQSELRNIIRKINPNLIVGKNDIAPRLLKKAMPGIETWFLSSSSKKMSKACTKGLVKSLADGIEKLNKSDGTILVSSSKEKRAVRLSDRIICDSDPTKLCFEKFYPRYKHKVLNHVFWSAPLFKRKLLDGTDKIKDFFSRSIDLLFVASRWSRPEKNYTMVKEIIKNHGHLNMHIVGLYRDKVRGAHYHGLLNYEKVVKLMSETKTLVATSLYDSSPNILFEASLLGCNVVASKNCGNWRLCNTELLVEPYCLEKFVEKISLSLKGKFNDNMNYFLKENPLDEFVKLIDETLSNQYYSSS